MKNITRDPPNRPKKPILGVLIAHQILQKPLGKMRISALWPHLGANFVCHLLFHVWFYYSTHPFLSKFLYLFRKVLPALGGKHGFRPRAAAFCLKMFYVLDPQADWETHVLVTVFARFVPFLVRLVFYALQSPIKSLLAARDVCVFSLCSPIRCIKQATDALKRQ